MPSVNVVPISTPASTPAASASPQRSPAYRSQLYASLLQGRRPANYSNIQSPMAGLAEALREGLDGYMTGKAVKAADAEKSGRAQALAEALTGGPIEDGGSNSLVQGLKAGVSPEVYMRPGIAERYGIPLPAPDPIKVGKNDRLIHPSTHEEIVSAVPDTPNSYDEYQLSQSDPAFADHLKRMSEAGADIGTIAPGYQLVEGPNGERQMVPIPGSPAERKAVAEAQAAEARTQNAAIRAMNLQDSISSIRSIVETAGTPVFGTASLPFALYSETPAAMARSYLGHVTSGVALNAMMRLKAASAQGATGFGAMNAKELDLLINDLGALNPDTTSQDIILDTLDRVQAQIESVKQTVPPDQIAQWGLEPLFNLDQGGESERGDADGWEDLGNGIRIREVQ